MDLVEWKSYEIKLLIYLSATFLRHLDERSERRSRRVALKQQ